MAAKQPNEAMTKAVMESMGITDYDEKVPTLLAEHLRREYRSTHPF
jgi:hypothetical protein